MIVFTNPSGNSNQAAPQDWRKHPPIFSLIILFDEAYTLSPSDGQDSFGQEAISIKRCISSS